MIPGFDWMATKALARQTVHSTFGVSATYQDNTLDYPVPITVRYHTKLVQTGDLEGAGYAEIIEGVDRIVFNRDQLLTANNGAPVSLEHRGVVTLTTPSLAGVQFWLETRDPVNGPVEEVWNVKRV